MNGTIDYNNVLQTTAQTFAVHFNASTGIVMEDVSFVPQSRSPENAGAPAVAKKAWVVVESVAAPVIDDAPVISATWLFAGLPVVVTVPEPAGVKQVMVPSVPIIQGANVTITAADNGVTDSTDVTIAATAGAGGITTISSNGTNLPQRSQVNFSTEFTAVDNSASWKSLPSMCRLPNPRLMLGGRE